VSRYRRGAARRLAEQQRVSTERAALAAANLVRLRSYANLKWQRTRRRKRAASLRLRRREQRLAAFASVLVALWRLQCEAEPEPLSSDVRTLWHELQRIEQRASAIREQLNRIVLADALR
jgi:hypothetical protein